MNKIYTSILMFFFTSLFLFMCSQTLAQQTKIDFDNINKEQILEMSYDQLLDLPFEDLMKLADIVGVSAEELLQMVLNKELSTASKKSESVFDSPLSATVITSDEIEQSGANSIEELFRQVQGMIVREKTNGNYDVHIRGNDNLPPGNFSHFSENTISLVMIDNRIVYNYINGGTFWETLPLALNDIERIDIVRGPSSALYGPNAASGVINIITKKPDNTKPTVGLNARYGNYNTLIGDFRSSFGLNEKLKFKITGNYEYRDRYMEDYYTFATGQYTDANNVISLFGYPYNSGERNTLPTPEMAKDRWSTNATAYFDPAEDIAIRLTGGIQHSEVQTVFFENLATSFSNRLSNTSYVDFAADIKGLNAQVSYMGGEQDLSVGMLKPVIHYDMNYLNANAEYMLELFEGFSMRPGFNYQQAVYNDKPYVDDAQKTDPTREGLLNGEQALNSMGASLRFDYKPIESLRLIAALRGDQYDKPDDLYFSYQFGGSYKLGDKHLFRAVYSRANRSAFIGSVYANFQNPLSFAGTADNTTIQNLVAGGIISEDQPLYYQYYLGNEELNLLTMNMFEVGHRWKVSKNFQTDIEIFHTITSDFDALLTTNMETQYLQLGMDLNGDGVNDAIPITHEYKTYENLDIVATQTGMSFNFNYAPNNKMLFKVFGTVQQTDLEDYMPDETKQDSLVDTQNDWTPSFYGGFTFSYRPMDKLSIFSNIYYMGDQVFKRYKSPLGHPNETGEDVIEAKMLFNLNVSYKVWENNTLYAGVRNLLNSTSREFGFADDINLFFNVGVNVNF